MNIISDKPIPFIQFRITKRCNYHCSYCAEEGRELPHEEHIAASDEVINAFLKLVETFDEQWTIQFIGGEALTHPKFFDTVQKIINMGHKVALTTNFSFPIESYKKLIDICGDKLKWFAASLHLEQVKSVDEFISKAIEFNNYKNCKTIFRILSVVTEDNWLYLKELKEKLNRHHIALSLQRLRINKQEVKYKKIIEDYLKKDPLNLAREKQNLYHKNLDQKFCNAGHKSLRILSNGEVKRCYSPQKNFEMGNITNKDFHLLSGPEKCFAKECRCCILISSNNIIVGGFDFAKSPWQKISQKAGEKICGFSTNLRLWKKSFLNLLTRLNKLIRRMAKFSIKVISLFLKIIIIMLFISCI